MRDDFNYKYLLEKVKKTSLLAEHMKAKFNIDVDKYDQDSYIELPNSSSDSIEDKSTEQEKDIEKTSPTTNS